MNRAAALVAVVAWAALLATSAAVWDHPAPARWEDAIAARLVALPPIAHDAAAVLDATAGTVPVAIAVLALAALLWWRRHRADAALVVGALVACLAVLVALKWGVHRPRPIGAPSDPGDPYGFPSGHAARAFVLAGLAALAASWTERPRGAAALVVAGTIWALLVSASRIVVEAHAPLDVVGSALAAIAVLATVVSVRAPFTTRFDAFLRRGA